MPIAPEAVFLRSDRFRTRSADEPSALECDAPSGEPSGKGGPPPVQLGRRPSNAPSADAFPNSDPGSLRAKTPRAAGQAPSNWAVAVHSSPPSQSNSANQPGDSITEDAPPPGGRARALRRKLIWTRPTPPFAIVPVLSRLIAQRRWGLPPIRRLRRISNARPVAPWRSGRPCDQSRLAPKESPYASYLSRSSLSSRIRTRPDCPSMRSPGGLAGATSSLTGPPYVEWRPAKRNSS